MLTWVLSCTQITSLSVNEAFWWFQKSCQHINRVIWLIIRLNDIRASITEQIILSGYSWHICAFSLISFCALFLSQRRHAEHRVQSLSLPKEVLFSCWLSQSYLLLLNCWWMFPVRSWHPVVNTAGAVLVEVNCFRYWLDNLVQEVQLEQQMNAFKDLSNA